MKITHYMHISLICLLVGAFTYAYFQEWIVFRLPLEIQAPESTDIPQKHMSKKKVTLSYWHKGKWKTETQELLWSSNKADSLVYLINCWLTLMDQENVMANKVTLQSAILTVSGQEAYCSFDRNPLPQECSTFEKWMLIEGILKTVRENGLKFQSLHFLAHHQPIQDDHLDFANPWPLQGFLPNA